MKQLKVGMPGLVEIENFNDTIDLCRELQLDFIELNMNLPSQFIESLPSATLQQAAKKHNLFYTMHMPDDADMGVFFDSVRKGYVDLCIQTIDWAKQSNVTLLNFHIIEGAKMTLPDKKIYIYQQYEDEFVHRFFSSFQEISTYAKTHKISINIENSGNFGHIYAQKALHKVLTLDGVNITWDIGHDAAKNYFDHAFLMNNVQHISHMHFHDVLGEKDHLVPFDGNLDLATPLKMAKNNGWTVVIEVKTVAALREAVYVLKQKNYLT